MAEDIKKEEEKETDAVDAEKESLTENEAEMVKRDDISGEEAHRAGEFEELNAKFEILTDTVSKMADVLDTVKKQSDTMNEKAAQFVENGAVVQDDSGDTEKVYNDLGNDTEDFYDDGYDRYSKIDELDLDM